MMSLFHCPYLCFQSLLPRPVSSVELCLKKNPPLPRLPTWPPQVSLQVTSFFTSLISGGSIVAGVTPTIMSSSSSSSFSPFLGGLSLHLNHLIA